MLRIRTFTPLALFLIALTINAVVAVPRSLYKRWAPLTGHFASETQNNGLYVLENNLWGENSATEGSQTTQATHNSGNSVSWYTMYTWTGGNGGVISYANLDLQRGTDQNLSSITSIPVTWSWSYDAVSSDLAANTAYDMWLSNQAGTKGASPSTSYEVMVWIGTEGRAKPMGILENLAVTINDQPWRLYKGFRKTWIVYTFQAPDTMQSYSSNLKPFFDYLIENYDVPPSHYLVQVQGGTEAYGGTAKFVTTEQTIAINCAKGN